MRSRLSHPRLVRAEQPLSRVGDQVGVVVAITTA